MCFQPYACTLTGSKHGSENTHVFSRTHFVAVPKVPMKAVASLGKENELSAQFPEM